MTTVVTDTCANMPPELTEVLQIEIVPYNPWGQSLVVALGSTGGGSCRNGTRAQRDAGATGRGRNRAGTRPAPTTMAAAHDRTPAKQMAHCYEIRS